MKRQAKGFPVPAANQEMLKAKSAAATETKKKGKAMVLGVKKKQGKDCVGNGKLVGEIIVEEKSGNESNSNESLIMKTGREEEERWWPWCCLFCEVVEQISWGSPFWIWNRDLMSSFIEANNCRRYHDSFCSEDDDDVFWDDCIWDLKEFQGSHSNSSS